MHVLSTDFFWCAPQEPDLPAVAAPNFIFGLYLLDAIFFRASLQDLKTRRASTVYHRFSASGGGSFCRCSPSNHGGDHFANVHGERFRGRSSSPQRHIITLDTAGLATDLWRRVTPNSVTGPRIAGAPLATFRSSYRRSAATLFRVSSMTASRVKTRTGLLLSWQWAILTLTKGLRKPILRY
jgi:hypothetical protein